MSGTTDIIAVDPKLDFGFCEKADPSAGQGNERSEELRPQPYPLLVDHFGYAWSQAADL